MKSKALVILGMVGAFLLVAGNASWARDRIAHRQVKQFKRIHRGAVSGKTLQREFIRLKREQRPIQRAKRRASKHLHFWHHPVYHGYRMSGIFSHPTWGVGWSVGWR
jgi:hypothetical protein